MPSLTDQPEVTYPGNRTWGVPDPVLPPRPDPNLNFPAWSEWIASNSEVIDDVNFRRESHSRNFAALRDAMEKASKRHLRTYLKDKLPYISEMVGSQRTTMAAKAARMIDDYRQPPPEMLDALATQMVENDIASQRGFVATVGDAILEMVPFAVELGTAQWGAGKLAKKVATGMMREGSEKAAAKSAAWLVGPAAFAASRYPAFAKSYAQQMAPTLNLNAAETGELEQLILSDKHDTPLFNAVYETLVETGTEFAGHGFDKLMKPILRSGIITRLAKKYPTLSKAAGKVFKPGEKMNKITEFLDKGAVNSMLGEHFEEFLAESLYFLTPGLKNNRGVLGSLAEGEFKKAAYDFAVRSTAFGILPIAKVIGEPRNGKMFTSRDVNKKMADKAVELGIVSPEVAHQPQLVADAFNKFYADGARLAMSDRPMSSEGADMLRKIQGEPPQSSPADTVDSAATPFNEEITYKDADVPEGIPFPEAKYQAMIPAFLYELANEMGVTSRLSPTLKAWGRASGDGTITYTTDLGKLPPAQVAKVMAHEIGHMDQLLTTGAFTARTGETDSLGRPTVIRNKAEAIASMIQGLRHNAGRFFADRPGAKDQPMTQERIDQWREFYEQLRSARKIAEDTTPLSIDDVAKIVDHLATRRDTDQNKGLISYLKNLPGQTVQDIMHGALLGYVHGDVEAFHRYVEIVRTNKAAVDRAMEKHFLEYAKQHQLHDGDAILKELIDLTKWIRPVDWDKLPKKIAGKLTSSHELMANAVGMFIMSPGQLKERAPHFFDAWTKYMEEHKLFPHYAKLVSELHNRPQDVVDRWLDRWHREDMQANEMYLEFMRDVSGHPLSVLAQWLENGPAAYMLDQNNPGKKLDRARRKDQQKVISQLLKASFPDWSDRKIRQHAKEFPGFYSGSEIEHAYDNMWMIDGPYWADRARMDEEIIQPLLGAGISLDDLNDYLRAQAIGGEYREGVINMQFMDADSAQMVKERLRDKLGEDRYKQLSEASLVLHRKYFFPYVVRAHAAGLLTDDVMETASRNIDHYSTFQTLAWLEKNMGIVTAEVKHVKGTLDTAVIPFEVTMEKMLKLHRATENQKVKAMEVELLNYHGLITEKSDEQVPPKNVGMMTVFERGSKKEYWVPEIFAWKWASPSEGRYASMHALGKLMNASVYRIFHKVWVQYSPSFGLANLYRDARRVYRSMGSRMAADRSKLRRQLFHQYIGEGMPEAQAKLASKQAAWDTIKPPTFGEVVAKTYRAKVSIGQMQKLGKYPERLLEMFEQGVVDRPMSSPLGMEEGLPGENQPYGFAKGIGYWEARNKQMGVHPTEDKQGVMDVLRHVAMQYEWAAPAVGALDKALKKAQGTYVYDGISKTWKQTGGKVFKAINEFNEQSEFASKMAAYEIATESSYRGTERAHLVRWYAGTPERAVSGYWTMWSNAILPYSKVAWNAMRAESWLTKDIYEAAMVSDKDLGDWSAIGQYVWRLSNGVLLPSALMVAAEYGLLGDELKELINAIPLSLRDNFNCIPLGWVSSGDGKYQPIMLTVPYEQEERFIAKLFTETARHLAEIVAEEDQVTPVESMQKILSDFIGGYASLSGANPFWSAVKNWYAYGTGGTPVDPMRDTPILTDTERNAGGMPAFESMAKWQIGQLGVLKYVSNWWDVGHLMGIGDMPRETTMEVISKTVPGIDRFIRVSDRGITDAQYHQIQGLNAEQSRFRLTLPERVRDMTATRNRYNILHSKSREEGKPITRQTELRWRLLNKWYSQTYHPLTKKIHAMEKNSQDASRAREVLESETNRIRHIYNTLD